MSQGRTEAGAARQRGGPSMSQYLLTIAARISIPCGFLAAALILPSFMFDRPLRIRARGPGPDVWPTVFLNAIAAIALFWVIAEIWTLYAAHKRKKAYPVAQNIEAYSYPKAALAIALLLAFGWLLPSVGFPIAATLFIFCWCFLGGIRSPVALIAVSFIGMLTLLWIFMGLALMPLSRGIGVFDEFTVWFLRLVRIY